MTAPSHLPPVRPRPSGVHRVERAPWWGKRDILCIFAVLLGMAAFVLGLIGALPHVADDAVRIINALHGQAAAVAPANDSNDSKADGGKGKPQGELSHRPSLLPNLSLSIPGRH